jgi:hypothetical protein
MTQTEIAALAISALPMSRRTHVDIMAIMQTLRLDTDAAVELRVLVAGAWRVEIKANGYDTDRAEVLGLAKTVVNTYARDVSLRAAA